MSFCPNCSHELYAGMNFCPGCGRNLADLVLDPEPVFEPEPAGTAPSRRTRQKFRRSPEPRPRKRPRRSFQRSRRQRPGRSRQTINSRKQPPDFPSGGC